VVDGVRFAIASLLMARITAYLRVSIL